MAKNVELKYFGQITDYTQCSSEMLAFEGTSVADLRSAIEQKYPGLNFVYYRVAAQHTLREEDDVIEDDSEIALLPQFSGG